MTNKNTRISEWHLSKHMHTNYEHRKQHTRISSVDFFHKNSETIIFSELFIT
jgi:hypothetical protein